MGTHDILSLWGGLAPLDEEPIGSDENNETHDHAENQPNNPGVQTEGTSQQFLFVWKFFSCHFTTPLFGFMEAYPRFSSFANVSGSLAIHPVRNGPKNP